MWGEMFSMHEMNQAAQVEHEDNVSPTPPKLILGKMAAERKTLANAHNTDESFWILGGQLVICPSLNTLNALNFTYLKLFFDLI